MIFKKLLKTQAGWSIFFLRLFVAWIFIKSGGGKLFGWFDGMGMGNFMPYLASLEIPEHEIMAYVVGWSELVAGVLLAFGFLTRLAALPIIAIMVVAIVKVHPNDFYYPGMVLLSALVFLQYGSGKLSVDNICTCTDKKPEQFADFLFNNMKIILTILFLGVVFCQPCFGLDWKDLHEEADQISIEKAKEALK